MKIHILNDIFCNNFLYETLTISYFFSILCGTLVITSKNPVVSVLFLIALFLSIASYLMLAGFNFIGLSYLLVYVGAVSILFLFILMLINVRISELTTDNNNSIPSAVAITVIFSLVLYKMLGHDYEVDTDTDTYTYTDTYTGTPIEISISKDDNPFIYNIEPSSLDMLKKITFNDKLMLVNSQTWDGMLSEMSHITTIGSIIYTVYPIWLILTSLILLLAMVGAIIITLK